MPAVRKFATGATRDADDNKFDYDGFLSPLALQRYGQYMHKHRKQSDGEIRDSDNWQKGMDLKEYMKSGYRHFLAWWALHRGWKWEDENDIEEALCALIFNASGYLHELQKEKKQ